jgi:tRNA nucleotidyltransferase/poly(A) polymerase
MSEIKVYIVGGAIRDEILGIQSKDIDYCVVAPSYAAMRQHVLDNGGKIYLEKPEYFAIRCKMPEIGDADFILARKEGYYSDGRRPDSVEPAKTIQEELGRRDFTCNTMAREVGSSEIIDLYGGRGCTLAKILRVVGDVEAKMREDSLRILRAIRFMVCKEFTPDPDLFTFLGKYGAAQMLRNLPPDRIREELQKCFIFDTAKTIEMLFSIFCYIGAELFRRADLRLGVHIIHKKA